MKNQLVNLKKKTVLPRDDDEIRAKYASVDYTQKQLAEEYGLSQSTISRIINKEIVEEN